MNSNTRAGEFPGVLSNLEAIARVHCAEPVTVAWEGGGGTWAGMATRTENGALIYLDPWLFAESLGHYFFHEVGHLALGHLDGVVNKDPLGELSKTPRSELLAMLTQDSRAYWEARVNKEEAEAEQYAADALASFERQFGPFLAALGIDGNGKHGNY